MTINYQLKLDETLRELARFETAPRLLLHSCCGPCSSYVLEYLTNHFDVTLLFCNPNIYPEDEYRKRAAVQRELIANAAFARPVSFLEDPYDPSTFDHAAAGLETQPEGGARCLKCFELRLGRTAALAASRGFDFFTTTLSVSPHKNADAINRLGEVLSTEHGVRWLYADFKKKNGYKRSLELSREYGLYRQDYCGCRYSLQARFPSDGL